MLAALVVFGLRLATPAVAHGNGIGDLYAAAEGAVLELHAASGKVVGAVDMSPDPSSIAFSNDGRSLYVATGAREVARIDIQTIQVQEVLAMPTEITAIAVPRGTTAVAAGPGGRELLLADLESRAVHRTSPLPGAADLLAADRREFRALAARSGSTWLAVVEAATAAVSILDVQARVVGLAVDRAGGAGFVVTEAPDQLLRIRLDHPAVLWTVGLPSAPTAVTSTAFGPVVAGASESWTTDGLAARAWSSEGAPSGVVAASDDGDFVYLGQPSGVLAIGRGGRIDRVIGLGSRGGAHGLAAFPARASLATTGASTSPPASVAMPVTSTLPEQSRALADRSGLFLVAAAVFLVLLAAGLVVVHRLPPRVRD